MITESKHLKLPEASKIAELRKLYPAFNEAAGSIKVERYFFKDAFPSKIRLVIPKYTNVSGNDYITDLFDVDSFEIIKMVPSEFWETKVPTYTSDDLFAMLPEWVKDFIMARLHDDPIYIKLDSEEEKLDNILKGSIDLHGGNFLSIYYELILLLCNSGLYGEKVK